MEPELPGPLEFREPVPLREPPKDLQDHYQVPEQEELLPLPPTAMAEDLLNLELLEEANPLLEEPELPETFWASFPSLPVALEVKPLLEGLLRP